MFTSCAIVSHFIPTCSFPPALYASTGPTCGSSANSQLTTLVNYLNGNCKAAWSGRVWLDIEGSQYWTGDTNANRNWYQVRACLR